MNEKMKELSQKFIALNEAKKSNLIDFPYADCMNKFVFLLKNVLKDTFGDNIEFIGNHTFVSIKAIYKGVKIEINAFNSSISLKIEQENMGHLINDFKEFFTSIVGNEPICSYNFCTHNANKERIIYPITEWSLNPENRLFNIVTSATYRHGDSIEDLNDFYTCSIIEKLGTDLFTTEGYTELFETGYDHPEFVLHKMQQIQKLNPNVDLEPICTWITEAKQHCYSDKAIHLLRKSINKQ